MLIPTAYGNRELQTFVRYDRLKGAKNQFLINPAIELGLFRNTQFKIAVPVYTGNAEREGSGNIQVSALYNFNQEGIVAPAIAISGQAEFPSGIENKGVDLTGRILLTKSISKKLDRIHLNFGYTHNADAASEKADEEGNKERNNRLTGVFGYSRRLGLASVIVIDYVYEQQHKETQDFHIAEVAIRHQITPRFVLSYGAGAGLTKDSPDFRINVGFQRAF